MRNNIFMDGSKDTSFNRFSNDMLLQRSVRSSAITGHQMKFTRLVLPGPTTGRNNAQVYTVLEVPVNIAEGSPQSKRNKAVLLMYHSVFLIAHSICRFQSQIVLRVKQEANACSPVEIGRT